MSFLLGTVLIHLNTSGQTAKGFKEVVTLSYDLSAFDYQHLSATYYLHSYGSSTGRQIVFTTLEFKESLLYFSYHDCRCNN